MKAASRSETVPRLVLCAETARDLMTANPLSIHADAAVKEAIAFLIDKGYSAAPVIDAAGRPIGVLSRTDILIHDRAKVEYLPSAENCQEGFQVENVDPTPVRDLMTPVVFSVGPETLAAKVVQDMLSLKVHRLFVVGEGGVLIGVISPLDVLKHLRPEAAGKNARSTAGPEKQAHLGYEPW